MSEVVKAKKKYHNRKNIRPYAYRLDVNLKGFLCICNNREKDCIREAYNLLNKYTEIEDAVTADDGAKNKEEDTDINDEMAKELSSLKGQQKQDRKFQVVESGAKNVLFIRTTVPDPVQLASTIVKDVANTKIQQTKFLIRLVPIEITCKAYLENINKAMEPLLLRYFKENAQTFSIVVNIRYNNTAKKDEIIESVAAQISNTREDNKVNLKEAEVTVVIEIIKTIAMIGVVPDYCKYKKYNLHAFVEMQPDNVEPDNEQF